MADDVLVSSEDEVSADDDELSLFLAQEIIKPKANAKIVGKKSNFSFFIEPKYALGK